jgi:hypothetical protein
MYVDFQNQTIPFIRTSTTGSDYHSKELIYMLRKRKNKNDSAMPEVLETKLGKQELIQNRKRILITHLNK